MKKIFKVLLLSLILILSSCSLDKKPDFTITKFSYSLEIGETVELDISHDSKTKIELINDNPELIDLDEFSVFALEEGVATISIKVNGIFYEDSITIIINENSFYELLVPTQMVASEVYPVRVLKNNSFIKDVEWDYSEVGIVEITDNSVLALKPGFVTIGVKINDKVVVSCEIEVKWPDKFSLDFELDKYVLVGDSILLKPKSNLFKIDWTSSNTEVATISEDGLVKFLNPGSTKIRASVSIDSSFYYEVEVFVHQDSNISVDKIIVDAKIANSEESVFVYDNNDYHRGINIFDELSDAIAASKLGSVIYVMPGVYKGDFNLDSDVIIVGPNKNLDPQSDIRLDEAIIEGKIRIPNKKENIELNGLAFTKDATITIEGQVTNFIFMNNLIYDTSIKMTAWTEQATYFSAFMYFSGGGLNSNNVTIQNNKFTNLGDVGINFSSINTFKIINNTFDGFNRDAVRVSNGQITQTSQWLLMNNTFKNGLYNGIFFRTYGSNSKFVENIISVFSNKFENVGQTEVLFSSAISFRNNQEGLVSINISYNDFINNKTHIFLRNNAETSNQANFHAYVNYNSFKGIPSSYYLRNKNNSDKVSTNPDNINMDYNYYANSENIAIDISLYLHKFSGVSSNIALSNLNEKDLTPNVYMSNLVHIDSTPIVNVTEGAVLSSSNDEIFTIDSEGKIIPKKEGIATLYVKSGIYQTAFPIIIAPTINIDYISLILEIAIGEEGYKEGPNNDTKYGTWYGMPNQPWCAMFVSWSANQANIPTSIIPKYASVQLGMDWFIAHDLFVYKEGYTPKAGDLIFFKSDGASHTGIVISSSGNTVYTIEGNTSDMVAKRSYSLSYSKITGYGLPKYPPYDGEPFEFDISGATSGADHSTN